MEFWRLTLRELDERDRGALYREERDARLAMQSALLGINSQSKRKTTLNKLMGAPNYARPRSADPSRGVCFVPGQDGFNKLKAEVHGAR